MYGCQYHSFKHTTLPPLRAKQGSVMRTHECYSNLTRVALMVM